MQQEEFDQFEEATYSHSSHQENERQGPRLLDGKGLGNVALQEVQAMESLQAFSALAYSPQQPATIDFQGAYKSESVWPQLGKISSAHAIPETPIIFDFVKSNSHQEPNNYTGQLSFLDLIGSSQNQTASPPFLTQSTPQDFLTMTLDNAQKPKNDLLLEFPTQEQPLFSNAMVQSQNTPSSNENNVESFNWESVNPQQSTLLYAAEGLQIEDEYSLFNQMSGNVVKGAEETIVTNSQEVKIESVAAGEGKEEEIFQLSTKEKRQSSPKQLEDPFNFGTANQPINIQTQVKVTQTVTQPIQQSDSFDLAYFDKVEAKQEVAQERKESNDFEFGVHVESHTHQNEPEQARKESEQFEFQSESVQNTPAIIQDAQVQENPSQTQEKEEEKQPESEIIQSAQQVEVEVEDDDDFGDFQETTVTETKEPQPQTVQTQQVSQNEQQDNQIRLNQNYEYPQNSQPYNTKKQELQSFVDSLPDYSFLFAKAFFT